jgi:hypothetical protein
MILQAHISNDMGLFNNLSDTWKTIEKRNLITLENPHFNY